MESERLIEWRIESGEFFFNGKLKMESERLIEWRIESGEFFFNGKWDGMNEK